MLKAFRKLISQTPDLNEVQQNVFDTVKEIQETNLVQVYNFDAIEAIENNIYVPIGTPIVLSEGNYILEFGGLGLVSVSSAPTYANVSLAVYEIQSPSSYLNMDSVTGLVLSATNSYRGETYDCIEYNTAGSKIQLAGRVQVSGGTVTDRNIFRPFLKIQRRSI